MGVHACNPSARTGHKGRKIWVQGHLEVSQGYKKLAWTTSNRKTNKPVKIVPILKIYPVFIRNSHLTGHQYFIWQQFLLLSTHYLSIPLLSWLQSKFRKHPHFQLWGWGYYVGNSTPYLCQAVKCSQQMNTKFWWQYHTLDVPKGEEAWERNICLTSKPGKKNKR